MLTSNTLAQLSELKKEIRSSKNLAEGTVRGTTGRYGFVTTDDGRDVYLGSDMMDRVLPGDRVEISVKENDRQQLEGKLEKLLQSPLKRIGGQYRIKGKGHFVAYQDNGYSRWIFVPPKERAKSQDGDYVTAKIIQHPFENGKPQAKVTKKLGCESNATTIRQLAITQHQLFDSWPKEVIDEVKALENINTKNSADNERADLSQHHFITIDAASTLDMDDALAIEVTAEGWNLWVAIADPGSEISEKSALYKTALQRAHTLYFPSKPLPMLPETLSTERYSLVANKKRAVLVCQLTIDKNGETTAFEWQPAIIESKAKLSYQQASELISNGTSSSLNDELDSNQLSAILKQLYDCAQKQFAFRKTKQLVLESRPDFSMRLNKKGKLESIERIERSIAHQIVEEAMIATNQCAGKLLAKHNTGIFSTHSGFKEERREDIEGLLKEKLNDIENLQTNTLSGYLHIIKTLQSNEDFSLLLSKQQRFQSGSELSAEARPHFGLGTEAYATVTSPIRRFQDLYNQHCIHRILQQKKCSVTKNYLIEKIKDKSETNRLAVRHMQLWLIADFMRDKIGQVFKGKIALLTNQGLGIRLLDNGIEGFIAAVKENKKEPEKPFDKISFNNQRLELTWNGQEFKLDQEVDVRLAGIDAKSNKLAFSWVTEPEI